MGWVVNATSRHFHPREKPGTHCIGGWVSPRVGLDGCGKSHPTGIRSPDHPARSESLYRLSYPDLHLYVLRLPKQRELGDYVLQWRRPAILTVVTGTIMARTTVFAVAQSVEALRYKSEGRGFDSRWCHWNFSLT